MKRTLDRNRQMRKIAQSVKQKWEKATVHSIDGDRVHLRLGTSPNLIRHVEVTGDVSSLASGQEVPILWKDNRPVVVAGAGVLPMSEGLGRASATTAVVTKVIRTSNQAMSGAETPVAITFDTAMIDTGGFWNPAFPTRLTAPVSGYYLATGCSQSATGVTTYNVSHLMRNGDTELAMMRSYTGGTSFPASSSVTAVTFLMAGEYVEFWVGSNAGAPVKYVDEASPTLSLVLIQ